jgi:hypothetical protein
MANPFQEVVETFSGLKAKFQAGEISRQQFIDEMKKLRLKDDQGRYWMIGAQTGKWYYFDGSDWVQAEPPSQKENKSICVYCGFENKIEAEVCGRCGGNLVEGAEPEDRCPNCGTPLEKPLMTCPRCASKDESLRSVEFIQLGAAADVKGEVFVLKFINPVSALLVLGILGLILGAVSGALAGAMGILTTFMAHWPAIIRDQQGKLVGALLDGLLGGAAGFAFLGLAGAALTLLIDAALGAAGGFKVRLARIWERPVRKTDEVEKSTQDATGFGFNLND